MTDNTPDKTKNLALFLDGTWNTVNNNTNVWRAKSLCIKDGAQIAYYSQGVGTLFGERFMGGAFGWGLDKEVTDAYEWLVEHYRPGDRIYLFGFSRGAYTTRSLAGLISKLGLLKPGSPLSIDQLYARYRILKETRSIRQLQSAADKGDTTLTNEERWLITYSQAIPLWFLGVWDTVGALGLPFGDIPVISRKQYRFLQTDLWINDDAAYHAMAVDEHRKAFSPTLFTWSHLRDAPSATGAFAFPTIENVEQRWFAGAHANVGGGYNDDLLAQRPLQWLMTKATKRGLRFDGAVTIDGDQYQAPIADSFAEMAYGAYKLFHGSIPYYRPIGTVASGPNDIAHNVVNETIDASVFERWQQNAAYRPKNLAEWATRNNVLLDHFTSSVRSDDPTVHVLD